MKTILKLSMIALLSVPFMSYGCTNPETPVGHEGYVYESPLIFGKSHFITTQMGPTSTGLEWCWYVYNVSITPYTANEDFQGTQAILSKDNLKISFSAHLIYSIDPNRVKLLIEKYNNGNIKGDWVTPAYQEFVQQQFRMIARDEVQKYDGLDVKDNIDPISTAITKRISNYLKDTPFHVTQAVVGNIQYPQQVEDSVASKLATTQLLQQKQTEIAIAGADAQKRIADAKGIAAAMSIINNQLTARYIEHEAVEAQKAMINSKNHTEVYVPVGPLGIPLVGNLTLGKDK